LGGECPNYAECFVMKARRDALAADVVVINHHLFFADVVLKDEGLADLLPRCNTVILDEAHQLPDTATLFFGEEVTAGQLGELARQAERSDELAHCAQRATEAAGRLSRWREHDDPEWIRWLDVTPNGWQLHASPLSVAGIFARQIADSARSWIFTSATLAVKG